MSPHSERRFSLWPSALSLQSMRGRMALLLGMAMLPAGAIAIQVGLNATELRRAAYEETLEQRADRAIDVERGAISEMRELVRVLATSPALQSGDRAECTAWLEQVKAEYAYIAFLSVTDDAGDVTCSAPDVEALPIGNPTDLRLRARERDAFTIGYVERSRLTQEPILGALEPLRDARGRRGGFVGVSITVDNLRAMMARHAETPDGPHVALVDFDGRMIVQSEADDRPLPSVPDAAAIRGAIQAGSGFIYREGVVSIILPMSAPDLYAVVTSSASEPAWRRWSQVGLTIAAPLLIWLLAVAAGWFAIEVYVARPLSTLETMARRFARGEEVGEAPELINAPVEIRGLRRTLAAMAKTLRGREARLVEALGEERALLRELHHRVKNNLQMVASLLNIQARGARDESEAWGLARAHDRVQLLAVVHQRIYASGEVREVRLDDIAAEVARQLLQSRGALARELTLQLHLGEARAHVDRAVPMSFLIGEAVSSALDVLTDAGAAKLRVFMTQDPDGELRFAVEGVAARISGEPALGGRLIEAFARQLGASVGRRQEGEYVLWARIPPAPVED
ncbi:MAG: sensor histidine kinase [Hyphomonadaceae bacterium]